MLRGLKKACTYWIDDQAAQMGAALAYYTLFSLAPILIIAISVAGQVFGDAAAKGQVVDKIADFIGADSAAAVQNMLENFRHPPSGIWAAALGLGTLLFGALGLFTQLRNSLNRIWRFEPAGQRLLLALLKNYLVAFLMVLVTSFFVVVLLTASTWRTILTEWSVAKGIEIPGGDRTWLLGDFLISTVLLTLLFAFTYRFMSEGHIKYRHILGGAIVSAMLFAAGKMLIGWYLGYTRLASAYGAAGSLVVFLVWVYYSAQIFFFGAEIIRVRLEKA